MLYLTLLLILHDTKTRHNSCIINALIHTSTADLLYNGV